MDTSNYDSIRDHTRDLFSKRWLAHDRMVLRYTLQSMLQGRTASCDYLAKQFDMPLSRVAAAFKTPRYDLSDAEEVVDVFGVNINENRPFTVAVGATTLHICCALVSLVVCQLSADVKTVLTTDPVSKNVLKITAGEAIVEITPVDTVAVLVAPSVEEFCADQWNSFCRHVRFYESVDTVRVGTSDISSAVTLPDRELMKIAELLSRRLWSE